MHVLFRGRFFILHWGFTFLWVLTFSISQLTSRYSVSLRFHFLTTQGSETIYSCCLSHNPSTELGSAHSIKKPFMCKSYQVQFSYFKDQISLLVFCLFICLYMSSVWSSWLLFFCSKFITAVCRRGTPIKATSPLPVK